MIIRTKASPNNLFFPETSTPFTALSGNEEFRSDNDGGDATYSEIFFEIYKDQTSYFRPNVSSYTDEPKTGYEPDEDSNFGPVPSKGNEIGRQVDFSMTSSFTGEEEGLTYKRIRSRSWEMCGAC
jgi:protein AFG1